MATKRLMLVTNRMAKYPRPDDIHSVFPVVLNVAALLVHQQPQRELCIRHSNSTRMHGQAVVRKGDCHADMCRCKVVSSMSRAPEHEEGIDVVSCFARSI